MPESPSRRGPPPVPVPADLLEAIAAWPSSSGGAVRVLLFLLRQTAGWRRDSTGRWASQTAIAGATGLSERAIRRALAQLEAESWIQRAGVVAGIVSWRVVGLPYGRGGQDGSGQIWPVDPDGSGRPDPDGSGRWIRPDLASLEQGEERVHARGTTGEGKRASARVTHPPPESQERRSAEPQQQQRGQGARLGELLGGPVDLSSMPPLPPIRSTS